MKTVTIEIPDDCEVKIVKKEEKKEEKKGSVIRTYQDLIDNEVIIEEGYWIDEDSKICSTHCLFPMSSDKNMAASEKVAKSMLAMAQISQLMPYYGGEVTDEEWYNINLLKHCITCRNNKVYKEGLGQLRVFLAFHTSKQRDEFLKYNEQLVKDYLMID